MLQDIGIDLVRAETCKKDGDNGVSHGPSEHVRVLVARMLMHGRQLLRRHFLWVDRSQWLFVGVPGFFETPNKFFCQRGPLLGVEFGIYSLGILLGSLTVGHVVAPPSSTGLQVFSY